MLREVAEEAVIPVNALPSPTKYTALTLADELIVPATFTPVPVTVIVVLPTASIVTLPFAVAMFTLLLPLLINGPLVTPVSCEPLPMKNGAVTLPPELILPAIPAYPATLIPVSVTVSVVFPTAATVTFPFEAPI